MKARYRSILITWLVSLITFGTVAEAAVTMAACSSNSCCCMQANMPGHTSDRHVGTAQHCKSKAPCCQVKPSQPNQAATYLTSQVTHRSWAPLMAGDINCSRSLTQITENHYTSRIHNKEPLKVPLYLQTLSILR